MTKTPGNQARILGLQSEDLVFGQLAGAGWYVERSPVLDYAGKTDVRTICPEGQPFDLQISATPKSKGQVERLEARGVLPIPVSRLGEGTAANFVCANLCQIVDCPIRPGTLPLGPVFRLE